MEVRMSSRIRALPDGIGQDPAAADSRWPELLKIAAITFAERGYRSTSLQDIADRFGIFKGSLYHYIRSKEDLLYEIMRGVLSDSVADLRKHAGGDGDALDRLRAVLRGHVRHLIGNLAETTVVLHEFGQLSQERQRSLPVDEFHRTFTALIAQGQREGTVAPDLVPELAALALLGSVNHIYRWYRPDGSRSPDEIADQIATVLLRGLAGPHGPAIDMPSLDSDQEPA
jgi:AcrR family transcriptional regulator